MRRPLLAIVFCLSNRFRYSGSDASMKGGSAFRTCFNLLLVGIYADYLVAPSGKADRVH